MEEEEGVSRKVAAPLPKSLFIHSFPSYHHQEQEKGRGGGRRFIPLLINTLKVCSVMLSKCRC